jgi:hypothetical protein
MRLKPNEFIRRFLLHTLPDGFHRIRYFGFITNGHRAAKIASCRALLVDEGLSRKISPHRRTLLTKTPSTSDASVSIAAEPCASSSAFFLHLRDATLPRRYFDATRHEIGFDDLRSNYASPKTFGVVTFAGDEKAAKSTVAGLFRCRRRQSSRHKNDQAPFTATPRQPPARKNTIPIIPAAQIPPRVQSGFNEVLESIVGLEHLIEASRFPE